VTALETHFGVNTASHINACFLRYRIIILRKGTAGEKYV